MGLYKGSISELLAAALGGSLLFGVNNILKRAFHVAAVKEDTDKYVIHMNYFLSFFFYSSCFD